MSVTLYYATEKEAKQVSKKIPNSHVTYELHPEKPWAVRRL